MRKLAAVGAVIIACSAYADATPDGAALFKGQTIIRKSQKVRDLASAEVQKRSDQELGEIIANGKGKMPGALRK